ncbi:MAG: Sapep family Mn(2+)-dependent dipeptidase [Clostridia bacterium]|nr:Sapep family Mn(2+)-dependent dipeptidase [Clostridia bacterium]
MLNLDKFLLDLKRLVKINSAESSPTKTSPFGEGVALALSEFCAIATELGFTPVNHQGYIAEITVGNGEQVGVIGHLDVVPEGDIKNWDYPPFDLTVKDQIVYGRGVSDDKGPLLICLYALKELVDSGYKFNKTIRLFAGTNEETGWGDIEYYQKIGSFPEYGFSPDGDFPVSYAEKGVMPTTFFLPKLKLFSEIQGGNAINAVCDYAFTVPTFIPTKQELDEFGLSFENGKIVSYGITAHGSTPEKGKNALKPLFEYLLYKGEKVKKVLDGLFYDKYNITKLVSEQGCVTISPNVIKTSRLGVELVCDVRVPYPFTQTDITQKFDLFAVDYTTDLKHPPMHTAKDGWFVSALMDAYKKVTGESDAKPVSMGGSTFARAFKYGCAFGAGFPQDSEVAHQPNEHVSIENINKCYQIYKNAFINLIK